MARTWRRWRRKTRAAKGVFLAMQYPVEIPGVTTMMFLKTALNAQRRAPRRDRRWMRSAC